MLGLVILGTAVASVSAAPTAPASLGNMILIYHLDQSSGPCKNFTNRDFLTIFGLGGDYVSYQLEGDLSDEGYYSTRRMSGSELQVTYQAGQGGPWQGNGYSEYLTFETPTRGTVTTTPPGPTGGTGGPTGTPSGCHYQGTFTVQP